MHSGHTYMHTDIHTCTLVAYIHTCTGTYIHAHVAYMHAHVAYIHAHVHTYMHM
jgi:hypothetical protein